MNIIMLKFKKCLFIIFIFLTTFNTIEASLKFNIPSYKDKCFEQAVYLDKTFLIRYDLTGFEQHFNDQEQQLLFNSIKIFIKDANGKKVYETPLKSRKDKIAVLLQEWQTYQICVRYFKPRNLRELPGSVMMGLKIRNNYSDIEKALLKEDVNNFWKKIIDIRKEMGPSLDSAKQEILEEDKIAKSMISSINIYYKLSCFQLAFFIVATIYATVSYQDYLRMKSII